jgi:hypothetical protein
MTGKNKTQFAHIYMFHYQCCAGCVLATVASNPSKQDYIQDVFCVLYVPSTNVKKMRCISTAKHFIPHKFNHILTVFARNQPLENNPDTEDPDKLFDIVWAPICETKQPARQKT